MAVSMIGGAPGAGAVKPAAMPAKTGSAVKTTTSQTSSSATGNYDKADANKDGVVTALEQITYDMKHPGASTKTGNTVDVKV